MSTPTQDNLTFRYSGFLQNVDIQFLCTTKPDGYSVACKAQLKLPIMKKNFSTETLFKDTLLDWQTHAPLTEEGAPPKSVSREQYSEKAVDPIGFFLKIHRGQWTEDSVHLVIGGKEVVLQVLREGQVVTVSRPERNQKLIIKMSASGIEALEVPVPIIGSLHIKRTNP